VSKSADLTHTQEETATGKVDYNYDMTDFPSEEAPGFGVFYKDQDGNVSHTYRFAERLFNLLLAVQQWRPGISMQLRNRVTQGHQVAPRRCGSVTGRVAGKFCLVQP